uniref:DUF4283 domain-containing protein n=1 Tax=Quercus lobata TaxID=97700 RepID=A0A7N2ML91_QUELO
MQTQSYWPIPYSKTHQPSCGKESFKSQLLWVVNNGPWSFDNHILLLRCWEKRMTAVSVQFLQIPIWVQGNSLTVATVTEPGTSNGNSSTAITVTEVMDIDLAIILGLDGYDSQHPCTSEINDTSP